MNTQAQTPLSRENVWLFVVQAQEFFGDLPGWQMAQRLAALDGIGPALHTLETAESYYRLGAGLQGAVSQMQSSIFAEETRDYCAGEAFGRLQERFAAGSSEQLVSAVESEMVARTELLQRLRVLERSPLSLTELARLVRRQGGSMPKDISARDENAGRLRQLLGEVKRLHKAEVRRLGAELVAKGFDDSAALDALAKTTAHFHSLAAANAERLLAV